MNNLTWLGHASVKLNVNNKIIYIDPFQLNEKYNESADMILLTHHHSDHYSPDDIKKIINKNCVLLGPEVCNDNTLKNLKIVKAGDFLNEKGIDIEVVEAYNINSEFHPKSAGLIGYIITVSGKRIYIAGDTDFIPEMLDLEIDLAFLPIGGTYTMNPIKAAECANSINTKQVIPYHYGAGIVGTLEDAHKFKELCNKEVIILASGNVIAIG
ncbi:MAG: MBL fold metallo-hydrolase [bacterium]|nr:MBL fold metallo-hydrolase [bacterium]